MDKRDKKLNKGIESLKEEIEKHFQKIEQDIEEQNIDRGRYHIKEIDKSLLKALEVKLKLANLDESILLPYKARLDKIKNELEFY